MESEYLELEARFYCAAEGFIEAKRRDERDAGMNKDFVAARKIAADNVNKILDEYLGFKELVTPLEPVSA